MPTVNGGPKPNRHIFLSPISGDEHAGAANSLNLLLRLFGEELGLDDHRLVGQLAGAEHLVDARAHAVDHGSLALGGGGARLRRDESPELLDVDGGAEELLLRLPAWPMSEGRRLQVRA